MNNASHLFFVVVLVNICIILHYRLHKDGYHSAVTASVGLLIIFFTVQFIR